MNNPGDNGTNNRNNRTGNPDANLGGQADGDQLPDVNPISLLTIARQRAMRGPALPVVPEGDEPPILPPLRGVPPVANAANATNANEDVDMPDAVYPMDIDHQGGTTPRNNR